MKKLLFLLLLCPLLVFGQEDKEPGLFEVVYLEVKKGQDEAFVEAVKKHNMEFHKEGKYHASVHYMINGPDGGLYSWVMGPTNWTAMDTRPGEGAHNDDWENVMKHVVKAHSTTYWKLDRSLSSMGTDEGGTKSEVWVYDLKPGKGRKWAQLVSNVKEVYEAKRPNESMYVYWNQFSDTNAGRDAAFVFPFNKYAWLDRDSNFMEEYESVHGEGSFDLFLEEFMECVNGRVDFLRERIE